MYPYSKTSVAGVMTVVFVTLATLGVVDTWAATPAEPSAVLMTFAALGEKSGAVYYASPGGMGDGSSWGNAGDLQSLVNTAAAGDEVWAAAGTYTGLANSVLTLKAGVAVYGGFSGVETERAQRDWRANATIIDGENARRCVVGANDAVLDGFTITRGATTEDGGGMYNNGAAPAVFNCTFVGNESGDDGGGMYNSNASPEVVNCIFQDNRASDGGGIYNSNASPTLANCIFYGNQAEPGTGGGLYNNKSASVVTNCTFYGNTAVNQGGGMFNYDASPTVTNCILWGNTPGPVIPEKFYVYSGDPVVTYSCIEGGYPGEGNIGADPLAHNPGFVDAASGAMRLPADSPCVDTGTSDGAPDSDIDGVTRPQGPGVDMGAYELPYHAVTFNLDGKGTRTGGGGLEQSIAHGTAAVAPEVSANPGWIFEGWDTTFDAITGPLTVNAVFTALMWNVSYVADPMAGGSLDGEATIQDTIGILNFTVSIHSGYRLDEVTVTNGIITDLGGGNYRLSNVTADTTVTAAFAAIMRNVSYVADPPAGGSLSGAAAIQDTIGTVIFSVTPTLGYHLSHVNADTGTVVHLENAEYQLSNVTADTTITAYFLLNTYTLTYAAGEHGAVTGTSPQTVTHGSDGEAVTAAPEEGYLFVTWSDGSTQNPRTDVAVTGDIAVTAQFAINRYTLTYTAGEHGAVTGKSPQTVAHGSDGETVTAAPEEGYHFVTWSDGSTDNPRTDRAVTGTISVSAAFAINTYTLTYTSGPNGTISGDSPQTVDHGESGASVTAVPDAGYHFERWSDGVSTATRQDTNVRGTITATASFAADPAEGEAELVVPDVTSLIREDAESLITSTGLVVGDVTEDCSDEVPEGAVIAQEPVAGSVTELSAPVHLVISTGPCPSSCQSFQWFGWDDVLLGGLALLSLLIVSLFVFGGGGGFIK